MLGSHTCHPGVLYAGKLRFSMQGGSSFHAHLTQWTPQLPGDNPHNRAAASSQGPGGHQSGAQENAAAGSDSCITLPELTHPRSAWLQQMLPDAERHFRLLAKVCWVRVVPAAVGVVSAMLDSCVAVLYCRNMIQDAVR